MPNTLKTCPKSNKSPNLVTLNPTDAFPFMFTYLLQITQHELKDIVIFVFKSAYVQLHEIGNIVSDHRVALHLKKIKPWFDGRGGHCLKARSHYIVNLLRPVTDGCISAEIQDFSISALRQSPAPDADYCIQSEWAFLSSGWPAIQRKDRLSCKTIFLI